jgi:ABC-type Mn2+/Zn2+ transport system permease subunit
MLELMLPALVVSLILVGIHGYLGIHIIARGVIFVDLAPAQVAALGWAAAGLGLSDALSKWPGIPPAEAGYAIGGSDQRLIVYGADSGASPAITA